MTEQTLSPRDVLTDEEYADFMDAAAAAREQAEELEVRFTG